MKSEEKSNFASFYDALPDVEAPKTEFIRSLSKRCGVVEQTARTWVKGRSIPKEESHLKIISEMTGISINELFATKE